MIQVKPVKGIETTVSFPKKENKKIKLNKQKEVKKGLFKSIFDEETHKL